MTKKILLSFLLLSMISINAYAGSFTFTTTDDWNNGLATNTNTDPPPDTGDGHIRLNDVILTPFNHIWVALSGRGTAVRINTDHQDADGVVSLADSAAGDGAIYGEYRTAPEGMATNPSRTTVDQNGDVWVGNRNEASGGQGSIVKLSANPTSDTKATSSGVWNGSSFDVLRWVNSDGADTNGGVVNSSDAATSLYVRTAGTNVRTIAVDQNNDVWAGGYGNKLHQKYDGDTGAPISDVENFNNYSSGYGGYGGLIDGNGVLWSSGWSNSYITRYDPTTDIAQRIQTGGKSYGLAVDNDGNIWNSHYDQRTITKLDSNGNILFTVSSGGYLSRGVAVTPDNDIWIANSGSNTVTRMSTTGVIKAIIPVGAYPTGVSVDSNGKVWVTNFNGNSVMRIDPGSNSVELTVELGSGATPYNYSDMTGTVVTGTTSPSGTWRKVMDGGWGADWDDILFNTELEGIIPDDTGILMEVRASNDQITWSEYAAFLSGDDLSIFDGLRYLEVRATLSRLGSTDATPVLSDLTVNFTQDPGNNTVPEPGTLALFGIGLLCMAGLNRKKNNL